MNREILFRGKTYNDEWVYGSLLQEEKRTYIGNYVNKILYGNKVIFAGGRSNKRETTKWQPFGIMEVIPKTIGQYTGLKDKNGNKIFEGDKVLIQEYWDGDYRKPTHTAEVKLMEYGWCTANEDETIFNDLWDLEHNRHWEVIGTIYDKEVANENN